MAAKGENALIAIVPGCRVQITGLQSKPELNDTYGTAEKLDPDSGRWVVRIAKNECLKMKPANLIPVLVDNENMEDKDEGLQKVSIDGKEAYVNPAKLKKEFDRVTVKYNLNVGSNAQEVANFLTDLSERSKVSVDEFAAKFSMDPEDAGIYMMYINLMVSFKEEWMDPKDIGL